MKKLILNSLHVQKIIKLALYLVAKQFVMEILLQKIHIDNVIHLINQYQLEVISALIIVQILLLMLDVHMIVYTDALVNVKMIKYVMQMIAVI